MAMRILGLTRLDDLKAAHADCRSWVDNWIRDVRASTWKDTHDIKMRYSTASFLANNVVIFNVRGNNYRIEVQVAFDAGTVMVKWAGTHAQYSKRS